MNEEKTKSKEIGNKHVNHTGLIDFFSKIICIKVVNEMIASNMNDYCTFILRKLDVAQKT